MFLVILLLIGLIPGFIANSKGRSFFAWWLYGMALFIVALPHALLLKSNVQEIESRALASGDSQKCPFCAEIIKAEATVCRYCGKTLASNSDDAVTEALIEALRRKEQGK